jgi:hypothetical protein
MRVPADEIERTAKRLEALGNIPSGASPDERIGAAKGFLAKLEIVKDIFAKDTGVARENLVFVPQPDFHVDMHMRPLAPGQILINDFDANIALLKSAMTDATPGSWEHKELQTMLEHAEHSKAAMGPVMDAIAKKCEESGLEVVRAPGVMEGQFERVTIGPSHYLAGPLNLTDEKTFTREELGRELKAFFGPVEANTEFARQQMDGILDELFTRHVNFMNAIPGSRKETNEQFYITNYTTLAPLRKAYEGYLRGRGVETVHWVGDHGGGAANVRSASEGSLQMMGGLDCRENH